MGIIVKSKVSEDLRGRTGTAFKNNALNILKTTFTVELNVRLILSSQIQVIKNGNIFTLTSGNWSSLISAFDGGNINFRLGALTMMNVSQSTTVVSVNGADLELTSDGGYLDGVYELGFFNITDAPEQFDVFVNLIENSVGTGIGSMIDGQNQWLSCTMVNALTVSGLTDDFTQIGYKSGGSQFTTKTIERISDAANGNKQYEIIVVYKNWVCDDLNDYFASECVGEFFRFQAFMINNDPSVSTSTDSFQSGNTGFQNENFNGAPSQYTLVSTLWEDDLTNAMTTFDFTKNSNFTITINSTAFNLLDTFNFAMFHIPLDVSEYKNRSSPIENNLMLAINPTDIAAATPTNITGNLNDDGAGYNITGLNFAVTAGVSVVVTGKVVPNATFTSLFESKDISDRAYKIWIDCDDSTLGFKSANTVNVLADDDQAEENLLPLGKMTTVTTFELEDHRGDNYAKPIEVYLEDDTLANIEFTLPKNYVTNPWLNIKMRVVAERVADGERFTLEEFTYDTSLLPTNTTTGILPLDYTENRGFKLPATSDKHNITVQLFPSLDTMDVFGVQIRYPFIIRYEDWLPMPQADNDFFGNKTQNWYPYSASTNWGVQFEYAIEVANGEYTDYLPIIIHDYDDWGESSGFSFEKLDGTPVTKPFTDVPVNITAINQITIPDWVGKPWVVIHARPENGAPQWLISTELDWSDLQNPLNPLSGETLAKVTVGTKIVTAECSLEPSNLDMSGNVTFTTRIYGLTTTVPFANIYKQTYTPAKSPIKPELRRGFDTGEEDRGYERCCQPYFVVADLIDTRRQRNDVNSVYDIADTMVVTLLKEDVDTGYVATINTFPAQIDAKYATIEWRDIAIAYGFGCYSIEVGVTIAGQVFTTYEWAKYELLPYKIDNMYMAEGTARVLSQFNNVNTLIGINMTGAFMLDSIRLRGKAGFNQPNTKIDNVEYQNSRMESVSREDFETYELRTSLLNIEDVQALRVHVISENNCWLSDHNFDSPDYFFFDKPVIVKEGYVPEYFGGSRSQKGVVIFEDKVHSKSAHFQDNNQTANAFAPPIVGEAVVPTPCVTRSSKVIQTGSIINYGVGDQPTRGRQIDFFTLDYVNEWLHSFRFVGQTGGYTDGVSYFDVAGVATTKALAFPNDIIFDFTSRNDEEVLTYYIGDGSTARSYNTSLPLKVASTIGGLTAWYLWNDKEFVNILNNSVLDATGNWINYAPFSSISALRYFITATRSGVTICRTDTVGLAYMNSTTLTNALYQVYVRYTTMTELGF